MEIVLSRQDASTADCPNKDGPCCLGQQRQQAKPEATAHQRDQMISSWGWASVTNFSLLLLPCRYVYLWLSFSCLRMLFLANDYLCVYVWFFTSHTCMSQDVTHISHDSHSRWLLFPNDSVSSMTRFLLWLSLTHIMTRTCSIKE